MHEGDQARYACATCAFRKVKCDRRLPRCGSCTKNRGECRYEEPVPSQRHRKRRADSELLARINLLEQLVLQHGIDLGAGGGDVNNQGPSEKASVVDRTAAVVPPSWTESSPTVVSYPNVKPAAARSLPEFEGPCKSPDRNNLSTELQNLTLHNASFLIFRRKGNPDDSTPWFPPPTTSNLLELHPEPRHIFKLWQIFAEGTNPLIKIVHAPTVQQRILDTYWNLEACSKSFHALLFSIYVLAVVSLSPDDCQKHFGETRSLLLKAYRTGAWQSLIEAGLFETRDLEVLQAFVLFLLSDPYSETSTTLTAVAVRLALKMGLDRENTSPNVSFFESEMRIRLWWQICTQDGHSRHLFAKREPAADVVSSINVRLPLNVNDAELHPDMVRRPVEHVGATEMVYVLLQYEGALWAQRLRAQGGIGVKKEPHEHRPDGCLGCPSPAALAAKLQSLDELQQLFEQKCLRYCDPSIPLHAATQTTARFALCRLRYKMNRVMASDSSAPNDALFDQAVQLLELDKRSRETPFTEVLLQLSGPAQLDAVVYLLNELRQRAREERVARAWNVVALYWDEHMDDDAELGDPASENYPFFAALADLTLDAWEVRWQELAGLHGPAVVEADLTPGCVKRLQRLRRSRGGVEGSGGELEVVAGGGGGGLVPRDDGATPMLSSQGALMGANNGAAEGGSLASDLFWFGEDNSYDFGLWSEFLQM